MKLNRAGIDLIKQFEGCKLTAYPDPGSSDGKPWTIGYGHTGASVIKGLTWTQEQADHQLIVDLEKVGDDVAQAVKCTLAEDEFSALVSLVFNIGIVAFLTSTLLKKLNKGDLTGAANEFMRWNKNDGKVMPGLTKRRYAERELFIS